MPRVKLLTENIVAICLFSLYNRYNNIAELGIEIDNRKNRNFLKFEIEKVSIFSALVLLFFFSDKQGERNEFLEEI